MITLQANIVTHQESFEGEIVFDKKIKSIKKISNNLNPNLNYILAGFIDLHIHGGGGIDIMDQQNPETILKTHAANGTTSLLLTTVTAKAHELEETFHRIEKCKEQNSKACAKILGIHLEGPYINAKKLGAQPEETRLFSKEEIDRLNAISEIKVITLAPELFPRFDLLELIKKKIIVQVGHSDGTYEEGKKALEDGAKSFTHLFNAMSGFHHRAPGIAGAALAHAEYSEIIPDLLHVHPGAIKTALRSIPKLYFVTDATSATGMPDGEFKLGSHIVHKCSNGVRLADGTLAGSALTMFMAFKNLISKEIDLSLSEASYRLSGIQSELLGIEHERGRIAEGLFADLVVLDSKMNLLNVYVEGEKV